MSGILFPITIIAAGQQANDQNLWMVLGGVR